MLKEVLIILAAFGGLLGVFFMGVYVGASWAARRAADLAEIYWPAEAKARLMKDNRNG